MAACPCCTIKCAQVVRKVDDLPVPGLPELIRKRKATQCFTTDTQALMDMSMFAKAIGKGLVDPTDSDSAPADPATESKSGCSCGPVCWPNCPHNPVHGDPTDFLRVRRMVKMTWAVARIQARWRGIAARKKFSAMRASQAPLTTDGGMQAVQAEREDALADLQVRGSVPIAIPRKARSRLNCFALVASRLGLASARATSARGTRRL